MSLERAYEALVEALSRVVDTSDRGFADGFPSSSHFRQTQFSPPYESPIEDAFAREAYKAVGPQTVLRSQVWMSTPWGNFRPDFIFEGPSGKQAAIECDGRQFHDPYADYWRDTFLLGSGCVDSIYRFTGAQIYANTEMCLAFVGECDAWAVSERSQRNFATLGHRLHRAAAEDLRNQSRHSSYWPIAVQAPEEDADFAGWKLTGFARRRSWGDDVSLDLYEFARSRLGLRSSLEDVAKAGLRESLDVPIRWGSSEESLEAWERLTEALRR